MRIAKVIGTVTLSRAHPALAGCRWRLVAPLGLDEISQGTDPVAEPLVAYDDQGAGDDSLVAIADGAEAAAPFKPEMKPIDAYTAAILDEITIARG